MAAPSITHPFVSAIADGADATVVRPSNWNAAHTLADFSGVSKLLGSQNAQDLPAAERAEVEAIAERFSPPKVIGIDYTALLVQVDLVARLIALEREREAMHAKRRADDDDDEDAVIAMIQ